jgi:hypothetical protein
MHNDGSRTLAPEACGQTTQTKKGEIMPKVEYTRGKGLVQSGGSDFQITDGTLRVRGGSTSANAPGMMVAYQAAAVPGTSNQTITVAQLKTGILYDDPEGNVTWTLPTATLLLAGLPGYKVGDCLDFAVINDATTTVDEKVTVAVGVGGTAAGFMIVDSNAVSGIRHHGSAQFRIRITSASAYTCYRIA